MPDNISPCDGGCWFCHNDDGEMLFSVEFDTYVHEECIVKESNLPADWEPNPEARIMKREFGL